MQGQYVALFYNQFSTGTSSFHEVAVVGSLMKYFETNYSTTTDIAYDDDPFDYESASEAVQFDVEGLDERRHRNSQKRFMNLNLVGHCFSKYGANLYRCNELADGFAALFDQAIIPVYDHTVNSTTKVGWIKMQEPRTTDMSEQMNAAFRTDGRHIVVEIFGVAQEL